MGHWYERRVNTKTIANLLPGKALCLLCEWQPPAEAEATEAVTAHTRETRHPTVYRQPAVRPQLVH